MNPYAAFWYARVIFVFLLLICSIVSFVTHAARSKPTHPVYFSMGLVGGLMVLNEMASNLQRQSDELVVVVYFLLALLMFSSTFGLYIRTWRFAQSVSGSSPTSTQTRPEPVNGGRIPNPEADTNRPKD